VGIVEYFQRRAKGKHLEGSRLFVYKATRNLMQVTGDTGAWLRNTMGLVLCGIRTEILAVHRCRPDLRPGATEFCVCRGE
jgi:hypothetical protein